MLKNPDACPTVLRTLATGLTMLCLTSGLTNAHAANPVSNFATTAGDPPAPWRLIQLDNKIAPTRYQIRNWDGVAAIEARANNSMALLARPIEINLQATPVLCWRWRVEGVVKSANLETKAGDDYAARIYVAFKLPANQLGFALRAKLALARSLYGDHVPDAAINYVWDNRYPVGTRRPNAYTDRTQMIVQRTGAQQAGMWLSERVNVLEDFRQAFGTDQVSARLLAVATDTDNTGEQAHAGFADIHFVARDAKCEFPPLLQTPG